MAMIGITGYASAVFTVTNSQTYSFADMGFSETEIANSDSAHISHISTGSSDPTLFYWYTRGLSDSAPLDPVAGATPEGHPIFPGGERIIRGIRNVRNFRVIAESGSARIAVTLGTFGRAPG